MVSKSKMTLCRSLKVGMVIALLCYVAFVLVGLATRVQQTRYPWTSPDKGIRDWKADKPVRRVTQASSHNKTGKGVLNEEVPLQTVTRKAQAPKAATSGNKTATTAPKAQQAPTKSNQTCPKTIASLAKYSKWFRGKYKPDMKLFLDRDDVNNYKNFLSRGLPFGFKGQNLKVVDEILQHENFANPPVHGAGGKQGCVRCAVVGCGGILNGSGAGAEIDGHDYVFRLNRAITTGRFAKDVGTRTTFYTFFPESEHLRDVQDKNSITFYAMFKAYDVDYALKMLKGENAPKYVSRGKTYANDTPVFDPRKLKLVHPGLFDYVSEKFLNRKARPTTGSIVVFLALHICDEVTIYGFGYDSRFTMHYYDTQFIKHTRQSTWTHDVANERKLWLKLHEEGVIRLFKRDV